MLTQLDDSDLAQLTNILENANDEFRLAEVGSEIESESASESGSEGESFSELDSDADSLSEGDSEGALFAQIDSEVDDDEMFDIVADFLAQVSDEDRQTIQNLVGAVMAQQYSDEGDILLAQNEGEAQVSRNEELDAVAEFLAQLDAEGLNKMADLVETKMVQALTEVDSELDLDADVDADLESENEGEQNEFAQLDFSDYDFEYAAPYLY